MKSEKQLYQWDVNQYLTELQPTAQFVDYPMGNEVIRIETDGKRCRIPDEFLQTAGFKTCYERYSDGTYKAYNFNVQSSPKPPDYVYTAEERTTFDALVAKADAAIEEIKRRADSGEFTPKKGVDYFTESEKNEMVQSVSSGAVGEFRKVVDTATTEYNRNAAEKLEAYNSNHAAKVAEYNQNAESKTAEFDSNAAALQTEVDRLRGECDNLAAENRKQENRIDALIKLNKGQTYDIVPEEDEAASRTAPSGAKYVSVDKVGGKSIVWNQLNNPADNINVKKGTIKLNDDGSITISGTVQDAGKYNELQISQSLTFKAKMKYMVRTNKTLRISVNGHDKATTKALLYTGAADWTGYVALDVANGTVVNIERLFVQVINLTLAFGAGNEPTAEQFEAMFPAESYPYNSGEIISGTVAEIDMQSANIFSGTELDNLYPCEIKKGETFTASAMCERGAGKCRYYTADKNQQDYYSLVNGVATSEANTRYKKVIEAPFDIAFIEFYAVAGKTATDLVVERGNGDGTFKKYFEPKKFEIDFPELHSAGTAHDEIDMDGGQAIRNIGKIKFRDIKTKEFEDGVFYINHNANGAKQFNASCLTPGFVFIDEELVNINPGECNGRGYYFRFKVPTEIDTVDKFMEKYGDDDIYFELETPTTEPVAIPEALQEWLPVEPGGTVTFRNADESKQLAVPNAVSWVRKLNEVN